MGNAKPRTKPRGKGKPRKPRGPETPPPPLPAGTEVMLKRKEAAAAFGLKPARFGQLVSMGKLPKADGSDWSGASFWKQSTVNEFINKLSGTPADAG